MTTGPWTSTENDELRAMADTLASHPELVKPEEVDQAIAEIRDQITNLEELLAISRRVLGLLEARKGACRAPPTSS